MAVIQVTRENLIEEFLNIVGLLPRFRYVAVDTEFPGFQHYTPRGATELVRYDDLKHNVDNNSVVQLGVTLFDRRGIIPYVWDWSWQFNFYGFGISPTKGIDPAVFTELLDNLLRRTDLDIKWVTFHGLYDIAYILKLATGGSPLPSTLVEFARTAAGLLGSIYDIKHIARFCTGIADEKLSLGRMASILDVPIGVGIRHQAGYDSFVTAKLFSRMKIVYNFDKRQYEGYLYGLESQRIRPEQNPRRTSASTGTGTGTGRMIVVCPHPLLQLRRRVTVAICNDSCA